MIILNYIFGILVGGLIAIMVSVNGQLAVYTNVYISAAIVHLIATLGSFLLTYRYPDIRDKKDRLPIFFYLTGILGAIIIVLNNVTFKALGVSITVALMLLGQMVSSLVIDSFGLLKMKKVTTGKEKIPGLLIMVIGIIVIMLN